MANLIYQYWDGELRVGCKAGVENMKRYATHIGAEYKFEHNPNYFANLTEKYSRYYGAFKPIYDPTFHEYDNVLFADTDIFAVDGLQDNIFEGFDADVGICSEPMQPTLRLKTAGQITSARDEQWATVIENHWHVKMPRTNDGLLQVYNSGVVLYSNAGLEKARDRFIPFKEYIQLMNTHNLITFYSLDQPYLHAMLEVAGMNWVELDNGWNSYIHYTKQLDINNGERVINDTRTPNTKFVHIQLAGADHWDAATLERVANLPQTEWRIQ